jgi:hypothetical protein
VQDCVDWIVWENKFSSFLFSSKKSLKLSPIFFHTVHHHHHLVWLVLVEIALFGFVVIKEVNTHNPNNQEFKNTSKQKIDKEATARRRFCNFTHTVKFLDVAGIIVTVG